MATDTVNFPETEFSSRRPTQALRLKEGVYPRLGVVRAPRLQQLHVDGSGRGYWVDVPTVQADAPDEVRFA